MKDDGIRLALCNEVFGHEDTEEVLAKIAEIGFDGVELAPDEYTLHRDGAWITTAVAPTASLEVRYRWSAAPDMAVTNWDSNIGNFLYYSLLGNLFADGFESGDTSAWSATSGGARGFRSRPLPAESPAFVAD